MDFRHTFVIDASWDKDELSRFWGEKIKGQGHIIGGVQHSTLLSFCMAVCCVYQVIVIKRHQTGSGYTTMPLCCVLPTHLPQEPLCQRASCVFV